MGEVVGEGEEGKREKKQHLWGQQEHHIDKTQMAWLIEEQMKSRVSGAEQGHLTLSSCGRCILHLSQPLQSKEYSLLLPLRASDS